MTNIEKIGKIKRETLSEEHYVQSLLEQGYTTQLLSDSELEKIQFDCLALLAKRTEQFNGGDSSSIRVEKAQDILDSMMFTVGVHLKTYKIPDDAVAAILKLGVEMVYAEGRKRINMLVRQSKMRHASLVGHLLQTENIFYAATIVDGINGFFKLYDAEFAAHEIHITADYPVYNKTQRLLGIEFIGQYLQQLYYENVFCTNFSAEDIHHLLYGYDEHYENLLLNIYEPVLAASLGCIIADIDAKRLEITPTVQSFLYTHFLGKVSAEIELILGDALSKLCESLSFSDNLMGYAKKSLPQLAAVIDSAINMGSLNKIFIVPRYPEDSPKLIVSFGEKMDDELYREVLDEFMSCQSVTGKISIMKDRIYSLADLEDLLLDAELDVDEITAILKSLSPAEIAALMKKYTTEHEMGFTELRDCEKMLCDGLNTFASDLSAEQQSLLENTIKILETH